MEGLFCQACTRYSNRIEAVQVLLMCFLYTVLVGLREERLKACNTRYSERHTLWLCLEVHIRIMPGKIHVVFRPLLSCKKLLQLT
jgi:hypothetical protein